MTYTACFILAACSLLGAAPGARAASPQEPARPGSAVVFGSGGSAGQPGRLPDSPLVSMPMAVSQVSPAGPAGPVSPPSQPSSPSLVNQSSPVSAVSPLPPASAPPGPAPDLPPGQPGPSGPLSRAEVAATTWLAVVDAGDYAASWRQGAGLLQRSVVQPTWESALQTGRQPLGKVKLRRLKSATFSRTLTGAPDGEYFLIQYETRFEFRPQAVETLTLMKDRDTVWRTAGYFIK